MCRSLLARTSVRTLGLVALPLLSALPAPIQAQSISPAQAALIRNVIGARVEAMTILGGDFGLSDGNFHSTGSLRWHGRRRGYQCHQDRRRWRRWRSDAPGRPEHRLAAPIAGQLGYLDSSDHLQARPLGGDTSELKTFAIEFGGGARFWTSQNLSFAPTVMALYGHTDNTYFAYSQFGRQDLAYLQQLGLADWSVDTWSVRPAVNVQYIVPLERALITFSSDPTGFFTHGFNRSNVREKVGGDSGLVVNKIDVDIPLDVELYGHELRSGGYLSRTDLFGDLKEGLGVEHVNEVHARLVLDFLNQLWKLQWLGVGASYLWGTNINGWTVGADVAFRF